METDAEVKPKKKVNGKANRNKGHNYERKWAKIFRDELGFKFCKTSRLASKLLDNSNVDLAFIPFNVQCKNVKSGLNYSDEIKKVQEELKQNFPPTDQQHNHPIIIAHKKEKDELIVMTASDFIKILKGKDIYGIQN